MPMPKAKPVYFLESMPQFSRTAGSTMPQPIISSQPVPLVRRVVFSVSVPSHTSISALGSVKGKKEGRRRILVAPNISWAK